jgi:hypothetical protein
VNEGRHYLALPDRVKRRLNLRQVLRRRRLELRTVFARIALGLTLKNLRNFPPTSARARPTYVGANMDEQINQLLWRDPRPERNARMNTKLASQTQCGGDRDRHHRSGLGVDCGTRPGVDVCMTQKDSMYIDRRRRLAGADSATDIIACERLNKSYRPSVSIRI